MDHGAIKLFGDLVSRSARIAVLTGAGISTASGIPDFRSANGVYSNVNNANVFDVAEFDRDPSGYYRFAQWFYPRVAAAQPNAAHRALARWEKDGHDVRIATQNVDDLHERAGSRRVFAVHGAYLASACRQCHRAIPTVQLNTAVADGVVPYCECGGVFKPDIVFFGESLPELAWQQSRRAMEEADLIVVVGTSLVVYPAASLPDYRNPAARLVIVNRDSTALDREADVVIQDDIVRVFEALESIPRRA